MGGRNGDFSEIVCCEEDHKMSDSLLNSELMKVRSSRNTKYNRLRGERLSESSQSLGSIFYALFERTECLTQTIISAGKIIIQLLILEPNTQFREVQPKSWNSAHELRNEKHFQQWRQLQNGRKRPIERRKEKRKEKREYQMHIKRTLKN